MPRPEYVLISGCSAARPASITGDSSRANRWNVPLGAGRETTSASAPPSRSWGASASTSPRAGVSSSSARKRSGRTWAGTPFRAGSGVSSRSLHRSAAPPTSGSGGCVAPAAGMIASAATIAKMAASAVVLRPSSRLRRDFAFFMVSPSRPCRIEPPRRNGSRNPLIASTEWCVPDSSHPPGSGQMGSAQTSAASMASTISGASGGVVGRKRRTSSLGRTRNFSKFHCTFPALPEASATLVSSA